MADEPTAPPPAPQPEAAPPPVAPPSPGKGDAPAVGGKKPPTKMIMAAVGGLVAIVVVVLLVMLVASLFSTSYSVPGTSPSLDDPKKAAETYLEFQWKKAVSARNVARSQQGDDLSYREEMAQYYEDKDKYVKERITVPKARAKFDDKNSSAIEKSTITCESPEGTDERKTIKYRVEFKDIKRKADTDGTSVDHYELKDEKCEGSITLARIGGKWKIVSATGPFAGGKELLQALRRGGRDRD